MRKVLLLHELAGNSHYWSRGFVHVLGAGLMQHKVPDSSVFGGRCMPVEPCLVALRV